MTDLLFRDVYGFVHDDPGGGFPAAGVGSGAFVGEVIRGRREQAGQGEVADWPLVASVRHVVEAGR